MRLGRGRRKPPCTPQQRALACDPAVAGGDAIRATSSEGAGHEAEHHETTVGRVLRKGAALVLFSGPADRPDGLPAMLRRAGLTVVEIDVKVGGVDHDLTRPEVAAQLLARVAAGEFDVVFIGTPCESFSVAHRPRLRTASEPWGVGLMPAEWQRYMRKHNTLALFTISVARAAIATGVGVAIENPADRGVEGSPAYWRRHSDHGSFWRLPEVQDLRLVQHTFAQCAFGAEVQKFTTIACTRDLDAQLHGLSLRQCTHGFRGHPQVAHGRDQWGRGRANMAAAYPAAMCAYLADAMAAWVGGRRTAPREAAVITGGRVTDGARLTASVCQLCREQRALHPQFASLRNLMPAPTDALAIEALPGSLHSPMRSAKPAKKATTKKGRPHPTATAVAASVQGSSAERPPGKIRISQLFLGSIYEDLVGKWLRDAATAALDLEEGRKPHPPQTLVIGQDAMPEWARGVVWDTSDPGDCRPVRRSTRDTIFPGAKQIDRAALRAAAAAMEWHDDDIIAQVGEGGIETRSQCELETVLAWHHTGFENNMTAAVKVITADIEKEWVSAPAAQLPFVPCRLLPRNVVMQERSRVLPDGSVEHYDKPRVSQDASDGAERSVNGGVPQCERMVALPTAQAFGRALAICDTAGTSLEEEAAGATPVRAVGYAVDATSAFRYCPLQWADAWTQCFVFWTVHTDADGRKSVRIGVCVDRRMGFGGAYAPNRFERVSLLVSAHVQAKQRAFDATQPLPACTERWRRVRAIALRDGELRTHAGAPCAGATLSDDAGERLVALWRDAQLEPMHLQCFIDDFNGTALDDEVRVPTEVAHVRIDPGVLRALGGVPASETSRAHVHARLTVLGMSELGLEAAGEKTMVGDPIISLGLRVDRSRRAIDCPPSKRLAIIDAAQRAQAAARASPPQVDTARAGTLVGRLCNLSQVLPEIRPHLEGGYRVSRGAACAAARGRRGGGTVIKLRADSGAHKGWAECLAAASTIVGANVGVAIAPHLEFPEREAGDTITCVTDASGHDGVGGYAFSAAHDGVVWIVSEEWPPDIKRALLNAGVKKRKRGREEEEWSLSMPAAELFGSVLVPRLAQRAGMTAGPVYAIGDCDAVAMALNAAYSRTAQMRQLLDDARRIAAQWLAVSVPREANLDADRLSHPAMATTVCAEAAAAGLRVVRPRAVQEDWDALRAAIRAKNAASAAALL